MPFGTILYVFVTIFNRKEWQKRYLCSKIPTLNYYIMKKILFAVLALTLANGAIFAQRIQQPLGRGVVAVYRSGGRSVTSAGGTNSSLISWRKLAQEPEGTTYNVYQRAAGSTSWSLMNSTPLTVTNYAPSALTNNTEYAVTAIVNGVEGEMSVPFRYKTQAWPNVWFDFDYDGRVINRDDYRTKFVWPMDLDGNGEIDAVVVDRLYAAAASNDDAENQSDNTATTSHKIQAYKLDGTLLWTVDMGPNVNICAGQNDMVLAYDINCDGRCEVIIRSSDGTRFWDKANETWGTYVGGNTSADTDNDGSIDYRTQSRRNPPFYISVIDGATGEELAYNELIYSQLSEGASGDNYSRDNRADYMSFEYGAMVGHYGIAYLDGLHPSLIMECEDRGNDKNHHGYILTWDFDWANGAPSNWHHSHTWVRNPIRPWCAEFHQIRILDSDGDGCDEMWAGGYGVNPAQNRYTSAGLEHGDRFIISDIDPDRPGLEGFAIQQSALLGQCLYDAGTGERIKEWYLPSIYDVARGSCMDVDPNHKGYEIYSFTDDYIYNCKGDATGETRSQWGISTCFEGLWWNGDLLREELSSPGGSGFGTNLMVTTVRGKSRLVEFSQESAWATHGGTGTRPAFMGDITGDWREEVILAKQTESSSQGLVGYTSNLPTSQSIYCLQQDPHYRGDCTTRGYYQHPNTGFYLGDQMPLPPLPPTLTADVRYRSGAWGIGQESFTTYDQTLAQAFADGQSVMFDITGDNTSAIEITGTVAPSATYLMNPKGHDFVANGTIAGSGEVIKSQQGNFTLNGAIATSAKTIVSEGTLTLNGSLANALELRARGTLAGNATLNGAVTFEGGLNYEGCRLSPGTADAPFGTITSNVDLTLTGDVFVQLDLQTEGEVRNDRIVVNGNLTLANTNTLTIVPVEATPREGEYVLVSCTGTLVADASQIKVRGLVGLNYAIEVREHDIVLVIRATREAAIDVTWSGAQSANWDYQTDNFTMAGEATSFVAGDAVIFPEEATQRTINLTDKMVANGIRLTHTTGTYTFDGEGGIGGTGDLVMDGAGNLVLNTTRSDYTGKTILNGGTTSVKNLENKGTESCFGAGTTVQIGRATLTINNTNASTDRNFVLTDTATLNIPNGSTSLKSALTGTGVLVKRGAGQLNLNYGGTNGYGGTILAAGTLSQGAWNATLGKSGSLIDVTGNAALTIFNNNSTSAVPAITNTINVREGKTLTVNGGQRCKVQGKLTGEGTLAISFPYVRGDFESNCAAFAGTLNVKSGQFRVTTALDMANATLELGAGVYVANYTSQSGSETSRTAKIGALRSSATDCSFGTGVWNIGYLGTDETFAGTFASSATVNKYGDGTLTLTGASAAPINIYAGELLAQNTSAPISTGAIVVRSGALLDGDGQVQTVSVQAGGTIGAGKSSASTISKLTVKGNLSVAAGGYVRLRTRSSATKSVTDSYAVTGTVKLVSPTFLVSALSANELADNAELKVFTGASSITVTGDVTFEPAVPKEGWLWDTSSLASDGIVRIVPDPTGIKQIPTINNDRYTVYDLSGRRIQEITRTGIYIINGEKVFVEK